MAGENYDPKVKFEDEMTTKHTDKEIDNVLDFFNKGGGTAGDHMELGDLNSDTLDREKA